MKIFFLLMLFVFSTNVSAEQKTLYVGALFELSDFWYAKYVNFFIDIIEYVFEQVQNNTEILADYSLKLITKDTKVKYFMTKTCLIKYTENFTIKKMKLF